MSIAVSPEVVCADCVLGVLLACMMVPVGTLLFATSWTRLKPMKGLKNLIDGRRRQLQAPAVEVWRGAGGQER